MEKAAKIVRRTRLPRASEPDVSTSVVDAPPAVQMKMPAESPAATARTGESVESASANTAQPIPETVDQASTTQAESTANPSESTGASSQNALPPADLLLQLARAHAAQSRIKGKAVWAMGAGLVPIPGVDIALVAGVQLKMIAEVAELYQVPFERDKAKAIIGALIGSLSAGAFTAVTASAIKLIPVIGTLAGEAAMSIYAGASTYAIGTVFQQHFHAGGTLLNFEPEHLKAKFEEMYRQGVALIPTWRKAMPSAENEKDIEL